MKDKFSNGDELAQPIEKFEPIYIKAKDNGLRLKAHIGEWGTSDDIKRGVEVLGLDCIRVNGLKSFK